MNNPTLESVLNLRRTFAASREQVFNAWTEPRAIERWFKPLGRLSTVQSLDLRVGGGFRFEFSNPEGGVMTIFGTYQEIVRPEKLVFTWQSEMTEDHETLVTLEFREHDGKTEVVLTHERFPSATVRENHQFGWTYMLDEMGKQF